MLVSNGHLKATRLFHHLVWPEWPLKKEQLGVFIFQCPGYAFLPVHISIIMCRMSRNLYIYFFAFNSFLV